jgi:hypothetical protein
MPLRHLRDARKRLEFALIYLTTKLIVDMLPSTARRTVSNPTRPPGPRCAALRLAHPSAILRECFDAGNDRASREACWYFLAPCNLPPGYQATCGTHPTLLAIAGLFHAVTVIKAENVETGPLRTGAETEQARRAVTIIITWSASLRRRVEQETRGHIDHSRNVCELEKIKHAVVVEILRPPHRDEIGSATIHLRIATSVA